MAIYQNKKSIRDVFKVKLDPVLCNVVTLLLLLVISAGCVGSARRDQLAEFSSATDTMIQATEHSLALAQSSEREYQISRVIAEEEELSPTQFDPLLAKNALEVRLNVLKLLDVYADSLSALARNDESEALESSARHFSNKANSLIKAGKIYQLTDEQKTYASQAALAIGTIVSEAIRNKSLNDALKKSDPHVKAFADLMAEDIGNETVKDDVIVRTGLRGILWEQYEVRRSSLEKRYSELVNAGAKANDRELLIREYLDLLSERDLVQGLLMETHDALYKFASVHAALAKTTNWNQMLSDPDISELRDQVDAFQQHVNRIRDFQLQLKEKE